MSGYGWGDEPINNRLMTWLDRQSENRVVIVEPDPGKLLTRSMILERDYDNWEKKGKMKIIQNKFEDADFNEILKGW
jgi:hypothetical protein